MIHEHMKMTDVVFENPRILLVLELLNIPLGFSEHTIAEICVANNVNERLFLTIANLYCFKEYVTIHPDQFDTHDAQKIVSFLRAGHVYFLDEKIPRLKSLIEQKTATASGDKYSLIIQKFINDYAAEVLEHINYEDRIVFPYVEALLNEQDSPSGYTIESFEKHHSNIEDKLTDLKNLLVKHLPPEYDSVVRRRMLFELYDLERDINIHDFIENKILIPVVKRLQKELI